MLPARSFNENSGSVSTGSLSELTDDIGPDEIEVDADDWEVDDGFVNHCMAKKPASIANTAIIKYRNSGFIEVNTKRNAVVYCDTSTVSS